MKDPPPQDITDNQPVTEIIDSDSIATEEPEQLPEDTGRQLGFVERMNRGKQAISAGNYENAISEFSIAGSLEPSSIEPLLSLAETQILLRQLDKAAANLKAAEQLDAIHPGIFTLRGQIQLRQKNFPSANKEFQKGGESANFWRGLMSAFYDREEEAQELLKKTDDKRIDHLLAAYSEHALYPDPTKTHIDALLAKAFNQIGEYELAVAKIKPVIAADPDYRDAWLLLGYSQFALEDYELARQSWNTAYSLDPAKPEIQYFLGLVNFELKNYDEAERFLSLAKENQFDAPYLEDKLAEIYYQQSDYRKSAILLTEKLQSNPTVTLDEFIQPIYLYLEKLKEGRSAWDLASNAIQRFPDDGMAYNLAGWVSLGNDYLPEAREQLEKAIELGPNLPWPHFNLGRYYEKSGDITSALAYYEKTLELDPEGPVGALAVESYNALLEEEKQP